MNKDKQSIMDFWNRASCGEDLYLKSTDAQGYTDHATARYALEPFILDFARFGDAKGKRVLEIGVGLGADHQLFAEAGAELFGVDQTDRALEHTKRRLAAFNLHSSLAVGDATQLEFPDGSFDIVYSWGVLHHTDDPPAAFSEVCRVLKPGGVARIMIYSKWSMVGIMLWIRFALLRLRPWTTMAAIYCEHLESPGTKAYTIAEARQLMRKFVDVRIWTELTHGDLLDSGAGQRHAGLLLSMARVLWPRWIIRTLFPTMGLFMCIEGRKSQ